MVTNTDWIVRDSIPHWVESLQWELDNGDTNGARETLEIIRERLQWVEEDIKAAEVARIMFAELVDNPSLDSAYFVRHPIPRPYSPSLSSFDVSD